MNTPFLNSSRKIQSQTPLAGDAGNRSYSRIKFQDLDKNFILCNYPEQDAEQMSQFIDVYILLSEHNVNTPKVIERGSFKLLLEDLGDTSLEDEFKKNGQFYNEALDELIKIQSIPLDGSSHAQSFAFTVDKFVWEMNFTLEHFTKLLNLNLAEEYIDRLRSDFSELSTHLCSLKQVITHRDFHSRNIMINNDKAYIIDFQDARHGPVFYDLVSLIEDSYTFLSKELKQDLIDYYCTKTNTSLDDTFMKNYHMQNLQRSFKACGSFASFKNRTNNERYLQYLSPALQSLQYSVESVSGFETLKDFITLSLKAWSRHELS